jgi:hypothetical protein
MSANQINFTFLLQAYEAAQKYRLVFHCAFYSPVCDRIIRATAEFLLSPIMALKTAFHTGL